MKFINIYILFLIVLFSNALIAKNIAIINIQLLIDNNLTYKETLIKIQDNQSKYLENFEIKEYDLKKKIESIENSKLILNEKEINLRIEEYNTQLNNFKVLVDNFNFHYQNQIINIREDVLMVIIKILEQYLIENDIDLVFDSTSYLIASNSLDITDKISEKLNKIKFNLEFKNFEQN